MTKDKDAILDWADTVNDLLCLIPTDKRQEVLAQAEKLCAETLESYGKIISLADLTFRSLRNKEKFMSHVIHTFARDIINNNSPADADKILFMQHDGPGSGRLWDYIHDLPSLQRRKRRGAA